MRIALLALLLAPALASAQAGRFLLTAGEVVLVRGALETRAAAGTAVEAGDTIRVGSQSNVQIRMSDGSIIALRSNTVFRIDEYVYSGRGDEADRSVFSLIKGGLRTVTGAIGRRPGEGPVRSVAPAAVPLPDKGSAEPAPRQEGDSKLVSLIQAPLRAITAAARPANPTKHAVRVPTGLVGIRGTHYTLVHCDNDCFVPRRTTVAAAMLAQSDTAPGVGESAPNGTYGAVSDGGIDFSNNAGDRPFGAQEYFYVASRDSIPQGLIAPPPFLYDRLEGQERNRGRSSGETTEGMIQSGLNADSRPSEPPIPPAPPAFVVTEQRNEAGLPAVVIPPPPSLRGSQGLSQGCPPFC